MHQAVLADLNTGELYRYSMCAGWGTWQRWYIEHDIEAKERSTRSGHLGDAWTMSCGLSSSDPSQLRSLY